MWSDWKNSCALRMSENMLWEHAGVRSTSNPAGTAGKQRSWASLVTQHPGPAEGPVPRARAPDTHLHVIKT